MPQRNVTSKNPPTQKRQIDVSRGKLGMDASPKFSEKRLTTDPLTNSYHQFRRIRIPPTPDLVFRLVNILLRKFDEI